MISSLKNKSTINAGQPKSPIARSQAPAYLSSPLRKKDNNTQNKQNLSNEVRSMSSVLSNSPSHRFTSVQQKLQAVLTKPATGSSIPVTYEQPGPYKVISQSIKQYQNSKEINPSKKLATRIQGLSKVSSSSNSSSNQSLSSSQSSSSLSSQDCKTTNKTKKNKLKNKSKRNASSSSSDSMDSSISSNSSLNSSFESNHKKNNKQVDKTYQKNKYYSNSNKSYDYGLTKAQQQAKKSIEQMNKIFGNDPQERLKISREVVKQLNQQLALERNKKVSNKHSASFELSNSNDSDSSLSSQSSSSFENVKEESKDKKYRESQIKNQFKENQQPEFLQLKKKKNPYL